MKRRSFVIGAAALALTPVGRTAQAQAVPRIERVASGFRVPWSLAFLPDSAVLITERGGRLWRRAPDGERTRISGVPTVAARGQGGLFDVVVARDFARTREVFLSYAKPQDRGQGTALAVARLDGDRLVNLRVIFEMAPGSTGGRHFGGRIVEARDGTLFLTIGERGDRPSAQDLSNHNGCIVRIGRDGGVPADNPFVAQDRARPEIWSYGHRNPQGAALDAQGRLWAVEHGARGGDELNRIRRGANFGWPVISYGRHYSGAKIGEGTTKPGMEQPAFYWDPSIAPSGLAIYSGARRADWAGAFFVGSLKFDHVAVLAPDASRQIVTLQTPETVRVRDVREGPDGAIWFLSEGNGTLCRIVPG
ncbi:PQQ-dependent sugar dehydrogenase [Marimonas arenosa]|uniref:PQQ-dependent sugar dehydrogenase n=1 Tax=Marimonas arenosa TaxID=1795305 RepID=A0AAE3W9H3_9RHOB|nr:PQQ-dependent sugar dehydrogenase [Marimonas arenosa]MDQ2088602.1 PQQ-dependent sugar dehydrogenase [Marimonas arenosa]